MWRSMVVMLAGAALGCAPPAQEPAADPPVDAAAVGAELTAFWDAHRAAILAGDAAAIAGTFSENGRVDVKGMAPILGRAALDSVLRGMFASSRYTLIDYGFDPPIVVNASLAYQGGTFVESYESAGKAMTNYGRFGVALMKEADGQWRLGYAMEWADSTVTKK